MRPSRTSTRTTPLVLRWIVLLRLPYLALSSVFAFIRLPPMSTADKGNMGPLSAFYQRIQSRRGVQVAIVATNTNYETGQAV